MRADRQTEVTKLTVAFRNFANGLKGTFQRKISIFHLILGLTDVYGYTFYTVTFVTVKLPKWEKIFTVLRTQQHVETRYGELVTLCATA
jgi:hypothetical protein